MKIIFLNFTLICLLIVPASAQKKDREGWEGPKPLLYSTPEQQIRVARRLGIAEGTWLVALMTIQCDACDRAAQKLEQGGRADRTVIVVPAPRGATLAWRHRLKLQKVRVIALTDAVFEEFGATIMPTFVEMKDGRAVRARENVPTKP